MFCNFLFRKIKLFFSTQKFGLIYGIQKAGSVSGFTKRPGTGYGFSDSRSVQPYKENIPLPPTLKTLKHEISSLFIFI
jgi:hypothetical protein